MKRIVICVFAVLTAMLICFPDVANRGTDMYINRRISASDARTKMQENPGAIILDVRTAEEFATGRIPGATLLPAHTIRERAHAVLPNKNALILVYCRSGTRSQEAACELISMGYTNVFDFGGIMAWPYERTN